MQPGSPPLKTLMSNSIHNSYANANEVSALGNYWSYQ